MFKKKLEDLMKKQITKYIDQENITPEQHHGGRPEFSTVTAKAILDNVASKGVENKNIVLTVTTDLSAAYDIIDHEILLDKLSNVGFEDNALLLMRSFLDNRKMFVEIQGFESTATTIGPYSVIQGTKNSGILFTIYNLEVVYLTRLMHDSNKI